MGNLDGPGVLVSWFIRSGHDRFIEEGLTHRLNFLIVGVCGLMGGVDGVEGGIEDVGKRMGIGNGDGHARVIDEGEEGGVGNVSGIGVS